MTQVFASIGEAMVELAVEAEGRFRRGFAGETLNTAWAVRALAPDTVTVRYVTALGHDPMSTALTAFMRDARLDLGHIRLVPDRRVGPYLISLDQHERSFHYWRDTSAARLLGQDPAFLQGALQDVDVAYLSGITLAILSAEHRATLFDALGAFRAGGGRIAFDGNVRLALWSDRDTAAAELRRAYRLADFALPTAEDEQSLFGDRHAADTAARLIDWGVSDVVVKCGPEPCVLANAAGVTSVSAEQVHDAVDTSGAGDSFNGAYLASRLAAIAPASAVRCAHRVAARVIRTRGALVDMTLLRRAAETA